jgi:hypothetical protein
MNPKNHIDNLLLTQRFEQAFVYAFQLHAHPRYCGSMVLVWMWCAIGLTVRW